MIISHQGSKEMLLSVLAICILFLFRRIMLATRPDKEHHHVPNLIKALKLAQTEEFREAMEELEEEKNNKEKASVRNESEKTGGNIDDFWTD